MWERRLPEPRLTYWWDGSRRLGTKPAPILGDIRWRSPSTTSDPFDTIGFNLYRDGRDSVAWHGDRERFRHEDPIVVDRQRRRERDSFMLRPRGGGTVASRFVGSVTATCS